MINRIVLSLVVAFVVFLGCTLLGALLPALKWEIATIIGTFLATWATAIGLAAGLYYFFKNGGIG